MLLLGAGLRKRAIKAGMRKTPSKSSASCLSIHCKKLISKACSPTTSSKLIKKMEMRSWNKTMAKIKVRHHTEGGTPIILILILKLSRPFICVAITQS